MSTDAKRNASREEHSPLRPSPRRRLSYALLLLVIGLLIALSVQMLQSWWARGSDPVPTSPAVAPGAQRRSDVPASSTDPDDSGTQPTTDNTPPDPDRPNREAAAGTWRTVHYGTRTVTMQPDGTAKMRVDLDFIGKTLLGAETLKINLTWSVEDGKLTQTLLDGTPANSVQRLIDLYGNTRSYKIIEINDEQMRLRSMEDNETMYVWEALSEPVTFE